MNRNDFTSGKERVKEKDPEIKSGQMWRGLKQHDFGTGLITYAIAISHKDPISDLWICSYVLENGGQIYSIRNNNAILKTEEIQKNFEFLRPAPKPVSVIPQPVNPPNGIAPAPYIQPPIYIPPNQLGPMTYPLNNPFPGLRGNGDVFYTTNNITTSDTIPFGTMVTSNTLGSTADLMTAGREAAEAMSASSSAMDRLLAYAQAITGANESA